MCCWVGGSQVSKRGSWCCSCATLFVSTCENQTTLRFFSCTDKSDSAGAAISLLRACVRATLFPACRYIHKNIDMRITSFFVCLHITHILYLILLDHILLWATEIDVYYRTHRKLRKRMLWSIWALIPTECSVRLGAF